MKCRVLLSGRNSIGLSSAGFAHSELIVKKKYLYRCKNSSVLLEVSDSKSRMYPNDLIIILKLAPTPAPT